MKNNLFKKLPKVDDIFSHNKIAKISLDIPKRLISDSINEVLNSERKIIKNLSEEKIKSFTVDKEKLISKIIEISTKKYEYNLKRVINASGVVIHTNLGRSLIPREIAENIIETASNYSNLEFNLKNGKRGSRYDVVEDLLCKLTGAEAALVVNNNASAVMLILNTLTDGKEVIVSRGQMVEIGGSFRIPEVMKFSGAKLVEIGTTNKTHLSDYENALTEETGAFLKVHTSNYKILGFTSEVDIKDLSKLGKKHDIPVIEDIGSGSLIDFSEYGLTKEPTVMESINSGVDVVSFSGDKMLGGPQAGIIIGKKKYIEMMKKNNLTRALRVDKMTFAALEGVLKLYLDEEKALKTLPTLKMLTMSFNELEVKAKVLYSKFKESKYEKLINVSIIDGYSEVGGGSMPLEKLKTKLISIKPKEKSVNKVTSLLREVKIPIICRINEENILIDLRTVREDEFDILIEEFGEVL
ncbi:L-seryl-tRNA(Sec) selenium transferase [Helicovermis profundi]|uniref:L-seryl-tRNA(Sec) selenium transferase n=1 Tax=Helicovermis profundi TaxID=3065157 RepID=A0AAU9E619_9FIRM|nr:L-seryl-tRNA(Sec) selenium transferase [Clostridia bacterium S502]